MSWAWTSLTYKGCHVPLWCAPSLWDLDAIGYMFLWIHSSTGVSHQAASQLVQPCLLDSTMCPTHIETQTMLHLTWVAVGFTMHGMQAMRLNNKRPECHLTRCIARVWCAQYWLHPVLDDSMCQDWTGPQFSACWAYVLPLRSASSHGGSAPRVVQGSLGQQ